MASMERTRHGQGERKIHNIHQMRDDAIGNRADVEAINGGYLAPPRRPYLAYTTLFMRHHTAPPAHDAPFGRSVFSCVGNLLIQ